MSLIVYLLASIIFATSLGYMLTWNLFTIIVLVGLAVYILLITLVSSSNNEEKLKMSKLLSSLFFGGGILIFLPLFSMKVTDSNLLYIFCVFIGLYTVFGRLPLHLFDPKLVLSSSTFTSSSFIRKIKLSLILYSITAFGLYLGYMGKLFFPEITIFF